MTPVRRCKGVLFYIYPRDIAVDRWAASAETPGGQRSISLLRWGSKEAALDATRNVSCAAVRRELTRQRRGRKS